MSTAATSYRQTLRQGLQAFLFQLPHSFTLTAEVFHKRPKRIYFIQMQDFWQAQQVAMNQGNRVWSLLLIAIKKALQENRGD